MKKFIPYLLGVLLLGALLALFLTRKSEQKRQVDQRVTLRRQDKIPYATYVAFSNLKYLFPGAKVKVTRKEPGFWDSVSAYSPGQAYIAITERFGADEAEMNQLISFAKAGNDVFISARYISSEADDRLGCGSNAFDLSYFQSDADKDGAKFYLHTPPFQDTVAYQYPGRTFYSYFTRVDSATTQVLGHDEAGKPTFIRLRTGEGNFYVHLEPLAFSNYFLLHKQNIGYYEKALSVIRPDVQTIIWDEYYQRKKPDYAANQKKKGWLSVLMNMKNEAGDHPFRAAFWLLAGLLVVYVGMEMRRRQRYIPVIRKPANDSLDFVKTIGRLYYGKGDHRNLCRKMAAYFLEHIRSKYKLSTSVLNEDFVQLLHFKSGVGEQEIMEIVTFIKQLEQAAGVTDKQLAAFHKQLESFYQKA